MTMAAGRLMVWVFEKSDRNSRTPGCKLLGTVTAKTSKR
jgi:hypothetical protein